MKALSIDAPGALSYVEVPEREPGPGEVRIEVGFIGYCGSDLSTFRGRNPLVAYPRIPGHEISGVIERLGPGCRGFAIGQRVTVLPYFNCGSCRACRLGRPNACLDNQTLGVQREGSLTERICLPERNVIPVDGMTERDLALVEPLAVGFHAARRAEVAPGDLVVVLGAGMIGLGAALGALARGGRVVAVDLGAAKLDVARRLGVQHVVDASRENVADVVRDLTGGDGAAVVIEAAGAEETFRQAIDLAGQCARVVYIGYVKTDVAFETRFFVMKEIDIRGSRGAERSDFQDVVAYMATHPGIGDAVVSRIVPLADAAQAMRDWDADPGRFTKILVAIGSEAGATTPGDPTP